MKYRIKFIKDNQIKFVPHLDMIRLYQRAIRRANLPIAYSNGFNPHQQMSFAQPLSLGYTSISEYMDIETVNEVNISEFVDKLNNCLPEGTYVCDMRCVRPNEKNAMASVKAAVYNIYLDKDIENFLIDKFLLEKELIVQKKSKKEIKFVNIRDDIFEIKLLDTNKVYTILAAGSDRNLKPDLFVECLYKFIGYEYDKFKIKYQRQELLKMEGGSFVSLF